MSTGAVLSQGLHRRQQSQLGRQGPLQKVPSHVAGPQPQPPPLSDTWPRPSQKWRECVSTGRCSHSLVSAVMRPSSVGIVPVNCRVPNNSLSPNPTSHHHINHRCEPKSQPSFPIRSVVPNSLSWRALRVQEPLQGRGRKTHRLVQVAGLATQAW